jgi:hypothetical protein
MGIREIRNYVWNELSYLRLRNSSGLIWTQWWTSQGKELVHQLNNCQDYEYHQRSLITVVRSRINCIGCDEMGTYLQLVAGFPPLWSGVRDRVCHVGICGGRSGAGVGFLRVLRSPLPNFIPPVAPNIILIYHRGLYNRPKWPQYQGLRYLGTWVDT